MASTDRAIEPSLGAALDALAARSGAVATVVAVTGRGREAQRTAGAAAVAGALAAAGSADRRITGYAPDGCPQWPAGFAGSIAHTDDVAVAAVSRRSPKLLALGIDVERAASLPADDARWVLAPTERDAVAAHPHPDALATLLWSAKEAAFKAWSSATGGLGSVDPVDIVVDLDEHHATVTVRAQGALGTRLRGQLQGQLQGQLRGHRAATGAFAVVADHVLTLVATAPASVAG